MKPSRNAESRIKTQVLLYEHKGIAMRKMKTGMGQVIDPKHLTHEFRFMGKAVPIGKFDPSSYPVLSVDVPFEQITQAVYDQLEDSGMMKDSELDQIVGQPTGIFVSNIFPRNQ